MVDIRIVRAQNVGFIKIDDHMDRVFKKKHPTDSQKVQYEMNLMVE